MGKLYLANCTKQAHVIQYRLPDNRQVFSVNVDMGRQEPVPHDLTTVQMAAVIRQLEASLGAVALENIDRNRTLFSGVCYSIDKPVPMKAIMAGIETNTGVLERRGHDLRVAAAVAINEVAGSVTANPNSHRETEVYLEEQVQGPDKSAGLRSTVQVRGKGGTGERPRGRRKAA